MLWFRKLQTEVGQISAALMTTIGGFLIPPPIGFLSTDVQMWPKVGGYVIGIITTLLIVIGQNTKQRRFTKTWFATTVIALLLAIMAFFGYRYVTSTRTCAYYDQWKIIGSELSADAIDYERDHPRASCEELLKAFTGDVKEIWSETSLRGSEFLLSITYLSVLPLLTVASIASLQAYRCSRNRR